MYDPYILSLLVVFFSIEYYKKRYSTLDPEGEDKDQSFIKIMDLGRRFQASRWLPPRCAGTKMQVLMPCVSGTLVLRCSY